MSRAFVLRRPPALVAATMVAGLVLAGCTSGGPDRAPATSRPAPTSTSPSTSTPVPPPATHSTSSPSTASSTNPIALGVDLPTAQQNATGLDRIDDQLGRPPAFTRQFLLWNSPFPTAFDDDLAARGIVLALSVRPVRTDGSRIPWASIAAAAPGSALYDQIVGWADRVRSYRHAMFFTFNHEPEAAVNDGLGSAADYIAAWRRIHTIFAAQRADNAHFLQIMTSFSYLAPTADDRYGPDWYPGDRYVDAIAADAYNFGSCQPGGGSWTSLASAIAGFVRFGAAHPDKPLYLTELGSTEDPSRPGRKSGWIRTAQALLRQPAYSRIKGIAYYDATDADLPDCDFPLSSSTSALAAFRAMALDPYYGGAVRFGG